MIARRLFPVAAAFLQTSTHNVCARTTGYSRLSPSTAFVSSSASIQTGTSLRMSSTATSVSEVKVGDKLPAVTLKEGQPDYDKPVEVNLLSLIAGKKVAIFAVPGAFTPGCSKSHLPSFITAKDELASKGIEMIICVATNDAYVMEVSLRNII
mmetsp:Transcript_19323/g.44034  ORF Transcript_19323/g.44034 Transcript_19323/m.44034 type:complete len:153 (-) Transcript_19323:479-937(-)